jgi:hypothetical protein
MSYKLMKYISARISEQGSGSQGRARDSLRLQTGGPAAKALAAEEAVSTLC